MLFFATKPDIFVRKNNFALRYIYWYYDLVYTDHKLNVHLQFGMRGAREYIPQYTYNTSNEERGRAVTMLENEWKILIRLLV